MQMDESSNLKNLARSSSSINISLKLESITPIPVYSLKDAEREFNSLELLLQGKETESNWEKKEDGLKRICALMKSYDQWSKVDGIVGYLGQRLRILLEDILHCTSSLRTTLAVTACITLDDVFTYFSPTFDPISDIILCTLFKPLCSTKKMIHSAASTTILKLLKTCHMKPRMIDKLSSWVEDKNVQIRIYSILFLQCILEVDPHKCSDTMLHALKKGISNAHPHVRELSRQCYFTLMQLNKPKSEVLLSMLDPSTRKLLTKSEKNSTPFSVSSTHTHTHTTSPPTSPSKVTSTLSINAVSPSSFSPPSLPSHRSQKSTLPSHSMVSSKKKDTNQEHKKDTQRIHSSFSSSSSSSSSTSRSSTPTSKDSNASLVPMTSALDTFQVQPKELLHYIALFRVSHYPIQTLNELERFIQQETLSAMSLSCCVKALQCASLPTHLVSSFMMLWYPYLQDPGEFGYWAMEAMKLVAMDHALSMYTTFMTLHLKNTPTAMCHSSFLLTLLQVLTFLLPHLSFLPSLSHSTLGTFSSSPSSPKPPSSLSASLLGEWLGQGVEHEELEIRWYACQVIALLKTMFPQELQMCLNQGELHEAHIKKANSWYEQCMMGTSP